MRRLLGGVLVGVGLLSLTGCGFVNSLLGRDSEQPQDPGAALDGVPIQSANEPEPAEGFAEPIVPAGPGAAAIASAELIQSTDPEERTNQILKNRTDPFAIVPIPPPPTVVPPPSPSPTAATPNNTRSPQGNLPPVSQRPGGTSASPQGTQTPRGNNRNPSGTSPNNPLGSRPPSPSPITPLPELPRPELASAVQITGVVQIGNKAHAIVKAPGEATSRYVTAGQRLANGRILVKRIEVREGIEPRVILEENGIEIAVTVGNSADGEASDQASLPDSAFALLPL